jgi:hypothetical protein
MVVQVCQIIARIGQAPVYVASTNQFVQSLEELLL